MHTERIPTTPNRPPSIAIHNRLLAVLPADAFARLSSSIEIVPLRLKEILHRPGEPIEHVYFPGGGFCSIVTVLKNGDMVEVATVGREGLAGASAMLGSDPSSAATIVQGETDTCYRLAVAPFHAEMNRGEAFSHLMKRYAQALGGTVMQSTACNAVHSVEQRLSRWLLMAHDRMGRDDFPLTQELVAMMLGATRPTVTVVAGTLQRAGLITYHHGHMTIVDRERLEDASCECYRAATDLLTRVTTPA